MSNELKCFVISPIGQPNSEIREHADAVLKYIIRPALIQIQNEGGQIIKAIRSDEMGTPGKIEEQMIHAILNFDLCIVILSGSNANVYYELAIAQSAGRPVVLMCHAGEPLPFDVKDYRTIYYDLKPKSMKEDTWVPVLAEQIREVLKSDYAPPAILKKYVTGKERTKSYLLNTQSKEFGDKPEFNKTVSLTESRCDLMGIALTSWGLKASTTVLKDLGNRRVKIRILTLDPSNPSVEYLINDRLPLETVNSIKISSEKMARHFSILAKEYPTITARTMSKGLPHQQIIITNQTALVLQYMFSRGTGESPLLQIPKDTELYNVFADEFEELWELNKPEE